MRYHSFSKSAMTALLVTMLIGATLGCSDTSPEDDAMQLIGLDELADAQGGDDADNPAHLALSGSLANGGWKAILSAIAKAGKYVSLDLSACAMTDTEVDPGDRAGAGKVTALILPNTAKSVKAGTYANPTFGAFTALRSISGAGVETIGNFAFFECESLGSVSLPAAQTIGVSAFYNTSLTTVSLPAAQTIGDHAFEGCTNLTEVSLPIAQTIGEQAFYGCTGLTAVSLPAAETIGDGAFYGCTGLTTIALPASLTTIGGASFSGCVNLTAITVASANPAFTAHDGMLLDKAETTLIAYPSASGNVTLPGIITIGDGAFYVCEGLTTVSLPAAQTIGGSAFSDCTSLTAVSLPAATSIRQWAFYGCESLTAVSLPTTPPSIVSGIFYSTVADGTITVSVPMGAVSAYTSAWGVDANTSAGGNVGVYGGDHKAVTITDAAQ